MEGLALSIGDGRMNKKKQIEMVLPHGFGKPQNLFKYPNEGNLMHGIEISSAQNCRRFVLKVIWHRDMARP